jgi:hypothetical protein
LYVTSPCRTRHVGLADAERAGGASRSTSTLSSAGRFAEDRRAQRLGKADGRLEILESDGQSVQRTDRLAARQAPIGLVSEREAGLAEPRRSR